MRSDILYLPGRRDVWASHPLVRATQQLDQARLDNRQQMGGEERLIKTPPDAEVEPPAAASAGSVDSQPLERLQLITEIKADQTEWRIEPHAWARVIAKVTETHRPWILPHVAGLDEDSAAEAA